MSRRNKKKTHCIRGAKGPSSSVIDTIIERDEFRYKRAFYYITRDRLREIVSSGAIRVPVSRGLDDDYDDREFMNACVWIPDIWLSSNPVFARSYPGYDLFVEDLIAFLDPTQKIDVVRIEVSPKHLRKWYDYMLKQGIEVQNIADCRKHDIPFASDARDWYFAEEPVGDWRWRSVEIWDGRSWIPLAESSDERDVATARLLSPHLTKRTDASGAGNDMIEFIRAQGGCDRIIFAASEIEYQCHIQACGDAGLELLMCDFYNFDPVFRTVQAVTTLTPSQASIVIAEYGEAALRILRKNSALARFIRGRTEAQAQGITEITLDQGEERHGD